jgi:nucleolar complex protein 3
MKEASATVDQQEKNRCQAKILEDIFVTFFRIIRKGGSNSPLLPVSMECIARYSHLINMELVVDLLEALCSLVR